MQLAVDDGMITWETMAHSIDLVVSTAALSKVPLDQMNAALVTLSRAGQQTSHAATGKFHREFRRSTMPRFSDQRFLRTVAGLPHHREEIAEVRIGNQRENVLPLGVGKDSLPLSASRLLEMG